LNAIDFKRPNPALSDRFRPDKCGIWLSCCGICRKKRLIFSVKASDRKRGKAGPSNPALQFNMENLPDKECVASGNGFASFIDWTLPGAPRTF